MHHERQPPYATPAAAYDTSPTSGTRSRGSLCAKRTCSSLRKVTSLAPVGVESTATTGIARDRVAKILEVADAISAANWSARGRSASLPE